MRVNVITGPVEPFHRKGDDRISLIEVNERLDRELNAHLMVTAGKLVFTSDY